MKQQSLASQSVFEKYGRKSRREHFLDEMEKIVPWSGPRPLGGDERGQRGRQAHAAELLHGEERKVWGDGGYQGQTEAIKEGAPHAQDMTCRRTKYKNYVDVV